MALATVAALSVGRSAGMILMGYAGVNAAFPLLVSAVLYKVSQKIGVTYAKLAWPHSELLHGKDAVPQDLKDSVPAASVLNATTDEIRDEISRLNARAAELGKQVALREEGPHNDGSENAPRL